MLSGGSAESRDVTREFEANASAMISFASAGGNMEANKSPEPEDKDNEAQLFGPPTRRVDDAEDFEMLYLGRQMEQRQLARPEVDQAIQEEEIDAWAQGTQAGQPREQQPVAQAKALVGLSEGLRSSRGINLKIRGIFKIDEEFFLQCLFVKLIIF